MRRLSTALIVAVCTSAAYHASAYTTLDQPITAPPPPLATGATSDAAHRTLVIVGGGRSAAPTLADTSLWSGAQWRQITSPGPSAWGTIADTLLYDGRAWTRLLDSGPARGRHWLAYDPANRTVLLYGGHDGRRRTSEIWALRARAWERLAP